MQIRQSIHSDHARQLDTQGLRREFLVEEIFSADRLTMTYSHIDRIVFGGIMPIQGPLAFSNELGKTFGVSYFLERRELGLINIGGPGLVVVDGTTYEVGKAEALYVGQGARELSFASVDDIDVVVTDSAAPQSFVDALRERNIEVVIAQ